METGRQMRNNLMKAQKQMQMQMIMSLMLNLKK